MAALSRLSNVWKWRIWRRLMFTGCFYSVIMFRNPLYIYIYIYSKHYMPFYSGFTFISGLYFWVSAQISCATFKLVRMLCVYLLIYISKHYMPYYSVSTFINVLYWLIYIYYSFHHTELTFGGIYSRVNTITRVFFQ